MKKIIIIVILFVVQISFSQKRYAPGYLYTGNNDSVAGKIKDRLFFSY